MANALCGSGGCCAAAAADTVVAELMSKFESFKSILASSKCGIQFSSEIFSEDCHSTMPSFGSAFTATISSGSHSIPMRFDSSVVTYCDTYVFLAAFTLL